MKKPNFATSAFAASLFAVTAIFVSCQSLQQEIPIQTVEEEDNSLALEIEKKLAKEDAAHFLGQNADSGECSTLASTAQKALAAEGLSKKQQARLLALQGRALFLAGQNDGAKKALADAQKKYPFDEEVLILENRLFPSSAAVQKKSDSPLMLLEDALSLYREQNYSQAAARFDTAFLRLEDFYKEAYNPLRQKAWSLKGMALPKTKEGQNIAAASEINVGDLLVLCRSETDLLDRIGAAKKISAAKLYSIVAGEGLLTSLSGSEQDNKASVPQSDKTLTRELAARFLWNLRIKSLSDKSAATKYSTRYRANVRAKSPVADVPVYSKDFDAILGCVEKELMALPDGRNFLPQKTLSGMETFEIVKNVK